MPAKQRTAYQQFVSDFAAANKGKKWGRGGLMRAAADAWRAAGHVAKPTKPKSACAGKAQNSCLPPCVWTQGPKRQYCHAKPVRSGTPGAPRAAAKRKSSPRPKLAKALHSCVGLAADPCKVAPNCYWQPSTKTCKTRSGAAVKQRMQGAERKSMLAQIRGQQGGYWW